MAASVLLSGKQPEELLQRFSDAAGAQPWDSGRFQKVRKLQDAPRNFGQVWQMRDTVRGALVAVKQMPQEWVCQCQTGFARKFPDASERPWVDIGCTALLSGIAYPYVCPLLGVFLDGESTRVVTELASEGDLFSWSASCSQSPGAAREAICLPLAKQLLDGLRYLHNLGIMHRDISAENVLLTRRAVGTALQVQIIDFGMSTTTRYAPWSARGKPSYQPPEGHTDELSDGFLVDAFAAGVTLYVMLLQEYPWLSTRRGGCKAFDYFCTRGLQGLVSRRKLRQRTETLAERMSGPLIQLLAGLLAINPDERLTLGEAAWSAEGHERGSVWEELWMRA